jgi:hypothetical protein
MNALPKIAVLAAFLCGVAQASGQEKTKDVARAVMAKYQDAVVYVLAEGKEAGVDFNIELNGTVLTADGLTAVCGLSMGFDHKREYTRITLISSSGKKLAASLVMRDEKIGVGFIAPTQGDQKLTHVEIAKVPFPNILDDTIIISRLGSKFDFATEVTISPVSAVVKRKPFTNLLVGAVDGGLAVFGANGKPLGVCVMRWSVEGIGVGGGTISRPLFVVLTHDTMQPLVEKAHKKWKETEK